MEDRELDFEEVELVDDFDPQDVRAEELDRELVELDAEDCVFTHVC